MVGVLAVNSPGFPVPRASAGMVAGAQVSLVAAGMVKKDCGCGCDGEGDCEDKKKSAHPEELRINMEDEMTGLETEEAAKEEEGWETTDDASEEDLSEEIIEGDETEESLSEEVAEEDSNDSEEGEESFENILATWDVEILFPESI
jgi:molecular chaperone DnaK (HSP70)